jgi:hypothetical protein
MSVCPFICVVSPSVFPYVCLSVCTICMFIYLSVCLYVCSSLPQTARLSVHSSGRPHVNNTVYLTVSQYVCLHIHLYCLFIGLFICLSVCTICLFIYLSVCLYVCSSVPQSIRQCLFICPSDRPSVCPFIHLSIRL